MTVSPETADKGTRAMPQRRSLLTCVIDRIVLWLLGFPPERCTYTTLGVRIPVSDGLHRIELAGDLLQPVLPIGAKPLGTVLQISPYGRGLPIRLNANAYAARGYQVLMVSSRGTFGSGGDFDPFRHEVEDGKGVVEWMREQKWYTGTFATVGGSYLSFTQWGVMMNEPDDLVAAVTTVSMHDASRVCWETGALNLDIVRWAGNIAKQEQSSFTWKALTRPKLEPVIRSVPLAQNVRRYLGDESRWVDDLIIKSNMRDPHYAPMKLERALDSTNVPILIITGWYDIFLEQSVEQYRRLKARGVPVAMTSGPWSHMKCALSAKASRAGYDWIEQHLGRRPKVTRNIPVEYFVTGAQEWRQVTDWPPPCEPHVFYLQAHNRLTHETTSYALGTVSFEFDPQDPTPTIGGNALLSLGAVNDSALAKRTDVAAFDSDILETEFEFCGQATVELEHSTSNPFADVFVRISDVEPNGRSTNITEGYVRLNPQRQKGETIKLSLNHTSHRFLRGRKIRVVIAGGNFPQYARNLGVDDMSNMQSKMRKVEHNISFSADRLSKIVFPKVSQGLASVTL